MTAPETSPETSQVTSQEITQEISMAAAVRDRLAALMQADERVLLIGEDVSTSVFGTSSGLIEQFGAGRILDTPISESAFVGMGIGAAMTGLRPVIEVMFTDFLTVCADPIINQAAKIRFLSNETIELPLVIRVSEGASGGGAAVHSQSFHGLFANIPGLVVACPSDGASASALLELGLNSPDPMILFEPRALYDSSATVGDAPTALGQGRILTQGADLTLVAIGSMVPLAIEAADKLAHMNTTTTVIDPITLSPMDWDLILDSVTETGRLLVLDESLGFAPNIAQHATSAVFSHLEAAPAVLMPRRTPVPYAREAEAAWHIGVDDIIATAQSLCGPQS